MNRLDKIMNHAPLFAEARGDIAVSFEFFPPKTEKMAETLWESVQTLAPLQPRFVSVTYGAGGSTRERTHQTVERILKETSLTPAAHLTCVAASRDEIDRWPANIGTSACAISSLCAAILPKPARSTAAPGGDRDAADLVEGLRKSPRSTFRSPPSRSPSGLARPGVRPGESEAQGGCRRRRAITQFFFSADCFFRFRDEAAAAGLDVEIVPGILPVSNVATTRRFAATCGASIPQWLDDLFEGLDDLPSARQLIAATVAAEICGQLYAGGVRHFHFYTLNRAELSYAICHLLGVPREMSASQTLRAEAAKQILIKDGPYGTGIQAEWLAGDDYCAGLDLMKDQKGNNDLLNVTQPQVVRSICEQFADAGAEILATNTFNANRISQADYAAAASGSSSSTTRLCGGPRAGRSSNYCATPAPPRFTCGSTRRR